MKNIIGNLKGFNLGYKRVGMNIPALIITWVIPLWGKVLDSAYRFLDVFSGTGTISFTEKTQPEYLFRTLLPQCVSIMARLP